MNQQHIIDDPLYKQALERRGEILTQYRTRQTAKYDTASKSVVFEQPMHDVPAQYFPCDIKDNF